MKFFIVFVICATHFLHSEAQAMVNQYQPTILEQQLIQVVETGISQQLNQYVDIGNGHIRFTLKPFYPYNQENSLRIKQIKSRGSLNIRNSYQIHIQGIGLNSLAWLQLVWQDNPQRQQKFRTGLFDITVTDTSLHKICGSWFEHFTNLETIDLSSNQIDEFSNNDFLLPNCLVNLNLSRNLIVDIPAKIFQQELPWLENLHLNDNFIWKLYPEMFSGLIFLNYCNLSDNVIGDLSANLFSDTGKIYPFFRLTIVLCNNFLKEQEQYNIDMHSLGFFKSRGNKIILEMENDPEHTPREVALKL